MQTTKKNRHVQKDHARHQKAKLGYIPPPPCCDFISRPNTNSLVSKYLNTVALMQLSSELESAEDGFCTHLVKARSESLDTIACIWAFCCSTCIAACGDVNMPTWGGHETESRHVSLAHGVTPWSTPLATRACHCRQRLG